MTGLLHDVRYALRQFGRNPGFTATAIITLALGIGATTAIFSIVNSVLLRLLPIEDPQRVVNLALQEKKKTAMGASNGFSIPDFEDTRQQSSQKRAYFVIPRNGATRNLYWEHSFNLTVVIPSGARNLLLARAARETDFSLRSK